MPSASALAHLLSRHASDWIAAVDGDGRVLASTPGARTFGYPDEFWASSSVLDVVDDTQRDRAAEVLRRVAADPDLVVQGDLVVQTGHGTTEVVQVELHNRLDEPDVGALLLVARTVTEPRLASQLLDAGVEALDLICRGERLEPTLAAVADLLHQQFESDGVLLVRLEGNQVLPMAGRGLPAGLLAAVDGAVLPTLGDATAPFLLRLLAGPWDGLGSGPVATADHPDDTARFLLRHGVQACWARPFPSDDGQVEGAVVVFQRERRPSSPREAQAVALAARAGSLALARHRLDTRRAWESTHDPLTGLANRSALESTLTSLLRRDGRHVSVLFVDLDQFKLVNDGFGHDAGDLLLQQAARRLSGLLEPEDTLARFGGDSFVVLLHSRLPTNEAEVVAERVTSSLAEPFLLPDLAALGRSGSAAAPADPTRSGSSRPSGPATHGSDLRREVFMTASVGLATTTAGPYASAPALLANADAALAEAKSRGRGHTVAFHARMKDQVVARLESENRLRKALLQREFVLHYQPVLDMGTGRIIGAEALIRWQPPDAEPILPAQFISVAEETGLIVPMGAWVLHTAIGQARQWATATGRKDLVMAVNVSPVQVGDPAFPEVVADALARHAWPAAQLVLELTETGLAHTKVAGREALARLSELGVGLAVDDFGTGYSSLGSLHQLPVSTVKIDRSFVASINGGGEPIVRAAVQIAGALGLRAIAEGIETEAQRAATTRLGCHLGQGFLFSRPVPAGAFLELLASS